MLIPDYQKLWDTMIISKPGSPALTIPAWDINTHASYYKEVSVAASIAMTNGSICPWQVIGIIHLMECSLDFTKHLHNGDPLNARTTHVPAGRPKKGNPPFTWFQSAVDAIRMMDFNNPDLTWDIPCMLLKLEQYNGLGYQKQNIYSPYLWSGTNHYTKGKYASDGHFDASLVSKQIGCAPILKLLL